MDYSEMVDAIDFTSMQIGVVGAGAAIVAVFLAIKGVQHILFLISDRRMSMRDAQDEWDDMEWKRER